MASKDKTMGDFLRDSDFRRCPINQGYREDWVEWHEKENLRLKQLAISRGWKPRVKENEQETT